MSKYHHIIMRQCLEIEIPDKAHYQEIQARIQNLAEILLNDVLDATFSNVVPNDVIMSIDQLHIPLEKIDQAILETTMLQQLQSKLLVVIQEEVHTALQDPLKRRITPLPQAKLQAIKHYLLYGYFAWWMPIMDEEAIESLYLEVYQDNANGIHELWLELSQHSTAIERFLNQFSSSTIQLTIRLLHPQYAAYLLDLADDLKKLEPMLPKVPYSMGSSKLPKALPQLVFRQSFKTIANGYRIQALHFLELCLQEAAHALGISYSVLLNHLSIELTSHPVLLSQINIAHQVSRLYEAQTGHLKRPEIPLPLLIKQLDRLLSLNTLVDNQQLNTIIEQICAQSSHPIAGDLLQGYLKSTSYTNRLIDNVSPAVFSSLMRVVNPNITSAWAFIKQIWKSVMPSTVHQDSLIERLTVKFLSNSSSMPQGEAVYMVYMTRQLRWYIKDYLQDWQAFIHANEKALRKEYGSKLVDTMLTTLPATDRPVQKIIDVSSQTPIDQYLLTALQEASIDLATHSLPSSWVESFQTARQVITSCLTAPTYSKATSKKLQATLQTVINLLIGDAQASSWVIAQLDAWINSFAQQTDKSELFKSISRFKEALDNISKQILLPQPAMQVDKKVISSEVSSQDILLLTKSMVQDFLTYQILPIGYSSTTNFIVALAQQAKKSSSDKKEQLSWIRQYPIQQSIWQNISSEARNMLLDALLPLSQTIRKDYYTLFIKADILRPSTPIGKELLLDKIFLDIASKRSPTTSTHFLHLTLLAMSEHAQLSTAEVYRRVSLVAQKLTLTKPVLKELQEISSSFMGQPAVADDLTADFLPIYEVIKSFVTSQHLPPELYVELIPWLQEVMLQESVRPAIQTSLEQILDKFFPDLSSHQKNQLKHIILENLQVTAAQRAQQLADDWNDFIQTGELPQQYSSPSALLSHWLDPLVVQDNLSSSPRQALVSQELIKTLKTAYTRKRLIAILPLQGIEKVVRVLAGTASNTVINWIQHIDSIWEFGGNTTQATQDNKVAWLDAALANLVEETNLQVQNWLKNSLIDFARFLGIQPADLIATLLSIKPPHLPIQAIHKTLQQIQEQVHQNIRQVAQKNWPSQPILQELYQAFTRGIGNLQAKTKLKLVKQINHLIAHGAADLKRFLYTYPASTPLSSQIIYHLPEGLAGRIIKMLALKDYSFIQQYMAFVILPPASVYQAHGIDVFNWRKQHELATLNYLLDKQEAPFDQGNYLMSTLNIWQTNYPQLSSILQAIIAYHRQHNHTSSIKQIIQQVENALLLHSSLSKGLEAPMKQSINTPTLQVQLAENVPPSSPSKPELKLYIKNSGLILIWPFIEEFFIKQELLDQGVFIDQINHNNALHALQYIVTEAWSTPDWRLFLNKLLCGMAYDEVTFAGYYLRNEESFVKSILEQQVAIQSASKKKKSKKLLQPHLPVEAALLKKNTEKLLATVLREWESLKELERYEPYQEGFSIQAFRQYILQREGMLEYIREEDKLLPAQQDGLNLDNHFQPFSQLPAVSSGYWHLTITGEKYDSLIIKTPWPMSSVQLPFMQEKIVVSWLS